MNGFYEVTLIGRGCEEIMLNIDLKTGKLIQAYCYAKDIPTIYTGPEGMRERAARTSEMKNPLFAKLNLGDLKTYTNQHDFYVCLEDEESEHYDEELNDIVRASIEKHLPTVEIL